jgi:DNA invertase Pin-like site-specific DNA recombinase
VAGQWIGYVRVSTLDQNEKRQLDGLVLDRVFTDKASGRDTARPQLAELLGFAREGDTVVVHSMDRLARNLDDLRALVQRLTRKGVRVEFVKEHLLFTGEDSPMANLMLSVWERSLNLRLTDQGTPAGRHRPGETARRL